MLTIDRCGLFMQSCFPGVATSLCQKGGGGGGGRRLDDRQEEGKHGDDAAYFQGLGSDEARSEASWSHYHGNLHLGFRMT